MNAADRLARRRWLALGAIRIAGVAGAMLGLILANRAIDTTSKAIGIALVIAALLMIAVVPPALAHRWRSREP